MTIFPRACRYYAKDANTVHMSIMCAGHVPGRAARTDPSVNPRRAALSGFPLSATLNTTLANYARIHISPRCAACCPPAEHTSIIDRSRQDARRRRSRADGSRHRLRRCKGVQARFERLYYTADPSFCATSTQTAKVNVLLADSSESQLKKGMAFAEKLLAKDVAKGKMSQEDADATRARLQTVSGIEAFGDVDLAIEVS